MKEQEGLPRSRLYEETNDFSHRGSQTETPKEDYYDNEAHTRSFQNEAFWKYLLALSSFVFVPRTD